MNNRKLYHKRLVTLTGSPLFRNIGIQGEFQIFQVKNCQFPGDFQEKTQKNLCAKNVIFAQKL